MMQKMIVTKDGKKYMVTAPGWNDDVGPGGPAGTLWMESTDGNWYAVNVTGTSGSAVVSVNQTPLTVFTNDIGYQLLYDASNGNTYQVFLSGTAGSVTINVNPVPWAASTSPKPYFSLQSVTDGSFYQVYLTGAVTPVLTVNQNSKTTVNTGW